MSIKVKNKDLERLMGSKVEIFSARKLPTKLLYWFSRLQKDTEAKFKTYAEIQVKLYEKYCSRNEDGSVKYGPNGRFQVPPENMEVAGKELEEMREREIEIGTYDKIIIDLNDKNLSDFLSPNDLTVLEPFIKIIEPKEKLEGEV
jgi:hypothetical protein